MFYSLLEAAQAVGRTKPALLNAIQKGRISAKKNEIGQWEIDPAELFRVYKPVNQGEQSIEYDVTEVVRQKEAEIMALRAKIGALEELKEELKQERDDWKKQADEWRMQAKALPSSPVKKRGFWARLFKGSEI